MDVNIHNPCSLRVHNLVEKIECQSTMTIQGSRHCERETKGCGSSRRALTQWWEGRESYIQGTCGSFCLTDSLRPACHLPRGLVRVPCRALAGFSPPDRLSQLRFCDLSETWESVGWAEARGTSVVGCMTDFFRLPTHHCLPPGPRLGTRDII